MLLFKYITNYKYYIRLSSNELTYQTKMVGFLFFHWQLAYDAKSHFISDFLLKISNGMKLCRKEIGNVKEINWKLKHPKLHCESGRTTADFSNSMSLEPQNKKLQLLALNAIFWKAFISISSYWSGEYAENIFRVFMHFFQRIKYMLEFAKAL